MMIIIILGMETEELQLEDEEESSDSEMEEEEEETSLDTTDQISYTSNSKPFQFTWKKEEDNFSMVGKQFRGLIPLGSNIKEAKNKKKLDFLLEFMNYWRKVVEFSNSKGWSYVLTLPKILIVLVMSIHWLGLVIYISLSQCPVINDIWNEDKPLYYRTHIKKHMTRDEFWKISVGTWKQNMGMPKDFQYKKTSGKQLESIRNGPPKTISVQDILQDGKALKSGMTSVGVSLYCRAPVTMLFTEKFDVNSKIEGGKKNALKFSFQQ